MLTTETERLARITEINANPMTREELEAEFGQIWDTQGLARDFIIIGISGKLLRVRSKADGFERVLGVQEEPRLYFDFGQGDGFE